MSYGRTNVGGGVDTSDATASPSDIMKGKTAYVDSEKITGVYVPLDTSDATAKQADILKGKTAYVNGEKITGNLDVSSTIIGMQKEYYVYTGVSVKAGDFITFISGIAGAGTGGSANLFSLLNATKYIAKQSDLSYSGNGILAESVMDASTLLLIYTDGENPERVQNYEADDIRFPVLMSVMKLNGTALSVGTKVLTGVYIYDTNSYKSGKNYLDVWGFYSDNLNATQCIAVYFNQNMAVTSGTACTLNVFFITVSGTNCSFKKVQFTTTVDLNVFFVAAGTNQLCVLDSGVFALLMSRAPVIGNVGTMDKVSITNGRVGVMFFNYNFSAGTVSMRSNALVTSYAIASFFYAKNRFVVWEGNWYGAGKYGNKSGNKETSINTYFIDASYNVSKVASVPINDSKIITEILNPSSNTVTDFFFQGTGNYSFDMIGDEIFRIYAQPNQTITTGAGPGSSGTITGGIRWYIFIVNMKTKQLSVQASLHVYGSYTGVMKQVFSDNSGCYVAVMNGPNYGYIKLKKVVGTTESEIYDFEPDWVNLYASKYGNKGTFGSGETGLWYATQTVTGLGMSGGHRYKNAKCISGRTFVMFHIKQFYPSAWVQNWSSHETFIIREVAVSYSDTQIGFFSFVYENQVKPATAYNNINGVAITAGTGGTSQGHNQKVKVVSISPP